MDTHEAIIRIALAIVLGSVVGLEREISQRSAGLRTHILVCLGSTVFTLISISSLLTDLSVPATIGNVDFRVVQDPGRIAAQIVTGIGFIGGGAVLRYGASIRGLTTAASLWMMASIGMMVGSGNYALSIIITLMTFLVLYIIGKIERTYLKKNLKMYNRLRFLVTGHPVSLPEVETWFEKHFGKDVLEMKSNTRASNSDSLTLTYIIDIGKRHVNVNELSRKVNAFSGVTSTGIRIYHDTPNGD